MVPVLVRLQDWVPDVGAGIDSAARSTMCDLLVVSRTSGRWSVKFDHRARLENVESVYRRGRCCDSLKPWHCCFKELMRVEDKLWKREVEDPAHLGHSCWEDQNTHPAREKVDVIVHAAPAAGLDRVVTYPARVPCSG